MINKKNTITDSELLFLKKYTTDVYTVNDITSIHIGKYEEGDFLENHIDERLVNSNNKLNAITLIFLINPAEIGGLLFLDGIDIELNNPGDYVIFDGQKTYHEVTKVEKGIREVLIVWLIKKNKNEKKLI